MRYMIRPRIVLGFLVASALGVLLAVASNAWGWSESTTFFVGLALSAVVGFFLTPLVLLPIDVLRHPRQAYLEGASERARRQRRS